MIFLYFQLAQDQPDNLVFSPFSLHTALAMLASGAGENSTTRSELLTALGDIQNIESLQHFYTNQLDIYKV